MFTNSESKRHFLNRMRRKQHVLSETNYIRNLPEYGQLDDASSTFESMSVSTHDSIGSEDNLSIHSNTFIASESSQSDENQIQRFDPNLRDYAEVSLTAILAHGNLTLNSANRFVNIVNNFIERFLHKSVKLPNVRSFWVKQVKESPLNVYIICENQHCHGPFTGEPHNYGFYRCGNNQKKAVLIQGNNFMHIPLRYQLSKYLPHIRESMWIDDFWQNNLYDSGSQILNLNLTLHADEVLAFNSSGVKIFPIFATINELKSRIKRRYFFLISLFVGTTKPNVKIYLNPVCKELKELSETPIQWTSIEGVVRIAYFRVKAIISDAPMRAYLRDVKQYNHIFGCDWCLIEASSANGARVYPNLDSRDTNHLKRRHSDFLDFQQLTHESVGTNLNPRFKGINGASPLLSLPGFNIVDGFAVEPMHCMILGVFRAIMNRGWINADSNCSVFSRSVDKHFLKRELSNRIIQIKVPSYFIRSPRSLDLIKFWKSNELDSFLCYYFMVSIRGLLQIRHINHILCLVRIYFLSHRESSSASKIQEIRELVNEFQHGSGVLYGSQLLSYNLHIMSHLADSCLNLGPTCAFSSYPLEDNMGILKNSVRRASNIAPSLVRIFLSKFRFKDMINSKILYWNLNAKEIRDFGCCDENQFSDDDPSNRFDSCTVIPSKRNISDILRITSASIYQFFQTEINQSNLKFYESIKIESRRFSTSYYCIDKKRDDSYVKIAEKEYIQIHYIFNVGGNEYYAIGKKLCTKPFSISFDGFTKKINFKLEYIQQLSRIQNDFVVKKLDLKMIQVIYVKSTAFYYTYKNDYIIEPFLMNF